MNHRLLRLFLVCLIGHGASAPAQEATPGVSDTALRVALQCERDFPNILDRHTCVAQRATSGSPQQLVARGWMLLDQGKTLDDRKEAILAFKAAARLGYPPAYQGLAIGLSHTDPALSAMWRQVAATSGLEEEATTYLKRLEHTGKVTATLHLIACHPAAYRERGLVRPDDSDAVIEAAVNSRLENLRLRKGATVAEAAQRYRRCSSDDSYYMGRLSEQDRAAGRKEASEMLKRVQRDVAKFPELQLLAWPAYEGIEP